MSDLGDYTLLPEHFFYIVQPTQGHKTIQQSTKIQDFISWLKRNQKVGIDEDPLN